MKKVISDRRLVFGYILVHLLLYFSFNQEKVFWYIFTASMLILISYTILNETKVDGPNKNYFVIGILSGIALYGVFWLGDALITLLNLPLSGQISKLYNLFSPENAWHYLVLILIIAPGEEIFWRGFIQKRILRSTDARTSILLSTLLYASVQIHSGEFILILAALTGGVVWGALYAWKRNIRLVVLSHIVFDLLLFVFLPLR
ncbi:hypothetical protein SAMN05192533_111112 [Mesobacillus persicus]|uniref:CAAX prenyl protease 2/Lysostaphin resistance protein A-like domain-containing protein n=1 Tax=Mesobacillus persicus TaxID=930146 RepID=A0A1H8FM62_9BACI|nr:type II CAAX endopeptidase family protein [Mesobacillus persicus]SEN32715.1 hypothetical protein SAMN05192533_111112 [Mesobacillus persicus]